MTEEEVLAKYHTLYTEESSAALGCEYCRGHWGVNGYILQKDSHPATRTDFAETRADDKYTDVDALIFDNAHMLVGIGDRPAEYADEIAAHLNDSPALHIVPKISSEDTESPFWDPAWDIKVAIKFCPFCGRKLGGKIIPVDKKYWS